MVDFRAGVQRSLRLSRNYFGNDGPPVTGAAMATALMMVSWNICLYTVVKKNLALEPAIWSYVREKAKRSSTLLANLCRAGMLENSMR